MIPDSKRFTALARHFATGLALIVVPVFTACWAAAAESVPSSAAQLGAEDGDIGFPGIGRVILGFLLAVGLAAAVALAMKQALPLWLKRKAASTNIRSLGRASLSPSLTVHLVEIEGERMVVAESRGAVSIALLPRATTAAQTEEPRPAEPI